MRVDVGVAQGAIRSPISFNLFIESLSRYLSTLPGYTGVQEFLFVLKQLLYADDLAVAASSLDQLQLAADGIAHWTNSWGMEANIGLGKTEVLHVKPAHAAPGPPPAITWRGPRGATPIPTSDS